MSFFYNAFWLQNPKHFRQNGQGGVKKFHMQTSVHLFCILYTIDTSCFVKFHDFHKKWKMTELWQVYDDWWWLVRNRIWQVFLIPHLAGFEDLSMQVIPIDLALQQLSSHVADKIVVELFCTQMIAIDKFINLGKRLHFIWCQKCCGNLYQLFILPFWMFFLSTPPNQMDLVIHFYLHFTYDWYLLSLNNWNRYSCE